MSRFFVVLLLCILLFTSLLTVNAYSYQGNNTALSEYIDTLCAEYGVSPFLVKALIERESSWDADAVNYNETCFGLMQIGQVNFSWLERELGISDFGDPYNNVRAGIFMLAGYIEKYVDYQMALMCYNCGENGAARLWEKGLFSSSYSEWIISRMNDMEWEALYILREDLYLQACQATAVEGASETKVLAVPAVQASEGQAGDRASYKAVPLVETVIKLKAPEGEDPAPSNDLYPVQPETAAFSYVPGLLFKPGVLGLVTALYLLIRMAA